jgi:hypothetical protein
MMAVLWGQKYSKMDLLRRVGDLRQLAGAQALELVDGRERGVRAVRLYNAAGLSVEVILDRGMALTDVSFHGTPLGFRNVGDVAHAGYSEPQGLGWLRTWPAGFLTPCGLTQVGSPCNDNGEELGQHGRLAGIPASNASWGGEWQDDEYVVWVEGTMHEAVPFGFNLTLKRRVWMRLDEPRFWIEDQVVNHSFEPAPHMLLQHFNLGFPLVDKTTRLEIDALASTPRDDVARPGLDTCRTYQDPTPGYQEQVFYHDLKAGPDGRVAVRLVNPAWNDGQGLSVTWRYAKAELPILVQWKMMGEGFYVAGIEPGNCHVEGRVKERERGTLVMLAPQETKKYTIELDIE